MEFYAVQILATLLATPALSLATFNVFSELS